MSEIILRNMEVYPQNVVCPLFTIYERFSMDADNSAFRALVILHPFGPLFKSLLLSQVVSPVSVVKAS